MALIKCKECGGNISTEAKACPHCGAKVKKPNGCLKVIGFFLAIVVIGALLENKQQAPKTAADVLDDAMSDIRMAQTTKAMNSVKQSLKDPDSLKWGKILASKDATDICIEFRAKNGFGGYAPGHTLFHKGKPTKDIDMWNKHCAEQKLYDMSILK